MSGFTIEIKPDDTSGNVLQNVKKNLEGVEDTAKKASQSISGMSAAINRLEGLAAATRGYKAELQALVDHTLKAKSATAGLEQTLRLEANILERLRGPMDALKAETDALERMHKRGALTAREYSDELERLKDRGSHQWDHTSLSQTVAKPKGDKTPKQDAESPEWGGVSSIGGAIENAAPGIGKMLPLIGAVAGAAIAAGAAIISLGDAYTQLSNAAEKIRHSNESVVGVIDAAYSSSVKLHAGMRETLELMDAVRDGTDEMNMTTKEQENLTLAVGSAIRLEGKSLSEAGHLTSVLAFAMAEGSISGRELKGIMKEYPDLAALMASQTGKTRAEMLKMAADGKFTGQMLVDQFTLAGTAMSEKLGDRVETVGEKMQHLKDKVTVAWGGIAQVASKALGSVIDNITSTIDPMEKYRSEQEAINHAWGLSQEISDKMVAKTEELIAVQTTLNTMRSLGIEGGENFDLRLSQSYAHLKTVMLELIPPWKETQDLTDGATTKHTQYAKGVKDMADAKKAEEIARQVKRIYTETHGVADALDEWNAKLQTTSDNVRNLEAQYKALIDAKNALARDAMDKSGGKGVSGDLLEKGAREIEIERKLEDAKRIKSLGDTRYGKITEDLRAKTIDYKRSLEDLTGAHDLYIRTQGKAGISNKEFYEGLKALGVEAGYTADVLKQLSEPYVNQAKRIAALNVLYRTGKIDLALYNEEMVKAIEAVKPRNENPDVKFEDRKIGKETLGIFWDNRDKATKPQENPGVTAGMELPDQSLIIANSTAMMALNDQFVRQREIMSKLNDPMHAYQTSLQATSELLAQHAITQAEANFFNKEALATYTAAKPKIDSVNAATHKWNDELARLHHTGDQTWNQMRNGINSIKDEIISGADASKVMVAGFQGISGAISDMVTKGKADWGSLVRTMLEAMTKMLLMKGMMSLFGITPPIGGGGGGLPGFATGGSFIVGGSGGTDSSTVAFRATPGERVSITPPTGGNGGSGSPSKKPLAGNRTTVINVADHKQAALAALNTREGETLVLNTIMKNIDTIAGHVTKRR